MIAHVIINRFHVEFQRPWNVIGQLIGNVVRLKKRLFEQSRITKSDDGVLDIRITDGFNGGDQWLIKAPKVEFKGDKGWHAKYDGDDSQYNYQAYPNVLDACVPNKTM